MTILEASVEVLRQTGKPLTSREILDKIKERNLYAFGAKDPLKVLIGTIRKEVSKGETAHITEPEKGRFQLAR